MNWALIAVVSTLLFILFFFRRFEQAEISAKEIALIATMTTLAAISRVPFAVLPSIQPTTFLVMITGYVFGAQIGFIVGALAALVSNFFLGQGPWTLWQMLGWGVCGSLAAFLAKREKGFNLKKFTVLIAFCGYLFGWIMNIWHWVGFVYPLNIKTFLATYVASFPFDTLHVLGNIVFSVVLGQIFYTVLKRFQRKFRVVFLR
jgi:energy-coupling factor transport system substrate-specific component